MNNNPTNKPDIIEVKDENNKTHKLELLDIVEVEEVEYALLAHLENEDNKDDEKEVAIMRLIEENDDFSFEEISDEEFEKVRVFLESTSDNPE